MLDVASEELIWLKEFAAKGNDPEVWLNAARTALNILTKLFQAEDLLGLAMSLNG